MPKLVGMHFFFSEGGCRTGTAGCPGTRRKKIVMLNNRRVDDYLDRLGKRLAGVAPGEKFPYQFKCVNDASINAFALPGGLYVNRGTIEAARTRLNSPE